MMDNSFLFRFKTKKSIQRPFAECSVRFELESLDERRDKVGGICDSESAALEG